MLDSNGVMLRTKTHLECNSLMTGTRNQIYIGKEGFYFQPIGIACIKGSSLKMSFNRM